MQLPGIVTNVTAFVAFVDIGVHQDGLVHISQLADRYVKDPNEVVQVHQPVEVTVLEVDLARKRIALGHDVRLIPPQDVKPYVTRAKNDRNDAEAICEAAGRPGMRCVLTKSEEQQADGWVLKVRETRVAQRTQLINTWRGHAAECGVIAAQGTSQIAPLLAAIAAEASIPAAAKAMLTWLGEEIVHLEMRRKEVETKLLAMHRANAISQLLATIPGIGPITASLTESRFSIVVDSAMMVGPWASISSSASAAGASIT